MGQGILDQIEHLTVELGIGAVHLEFDLLVQLAREVANDARQLLPGIADRLHPRLHDAFLQPNGYILGEEGSGALCRPACAMAKGTLYTKNAGDLRVFWQGPSVGFDWGGDGARTLTLVYNLPSHSCDLSAPSPASMVPPISSAASA